MVNLSSLFLLVGMIVVEWTKPLENLELPPLTIEA